jgi:hypothetical protein
MIADVLMGHDGATPVTTMTFLATTTTRPAKMRYL